MNNKKRILSLAYAAVTAAVYVVLTLIFAPISYGAIQFRISEVLCILPIFSFTAVPGIFIGCLLANYFAGAAVLDIIFGSIASLIGAYGTWLLRKKPYAAVIPPIVSNTLIIPFVLRYGYGIEGALPFLMLTVGIGEILAIGILGTLFRIALDKYKKIIFGSILAE